MTGTTRCNCFWFCIDCYPDTIRDDTIVFTDEGCDRTVHEYNDAILHTEVQTVRFRARLIQQATLTSLDHKQIRLKIRVGLLKHRYRYLMTSCTLPQFVTIRIACPQLMMIFRCVITFKMVKIECYFKYYGDDD
jgi:hypothetical protein